MEHDDFKEALDADEKSRICCFKCGEKFYSEDADIKESLKREYDKLKPLYTTNQKEYHKRIKAVQKAFEKTITLELVDHVVPEDICKEEISVSFPLCPSCLINLMEANGYEYCERCETYSKNMTSVCTDPGRTSGPAENCYPPEYEDMCQSCADKHNDD